MVLNFHRFIDQVDYGRAENTKSLKFNTRNMHDLLQRCWILSGSKTKDFMGQFQMGTDLTS